MRILLRILKKYVTLVCNNKLESERVLNHQVNFELDIHIRTHSIVFPFEVEREREMRRILRIYEKKKYVRRRSRRLYRIP